MRLLWVLIILSCFILPFLPNQAYAEMTSTNYRITSTVLSGGGNAMSSVSFRLESTLGQPGTICSSSSDSYSIDSGFWHTVLLSVIGDVNGDGSVDLEDVITALQVVTGQTPENIIKAADVDGDGVIGLIEALSVLHKLSK